MPFLTLPQIAFVYNMNSSYISFFLKQILFLISEFLMYIKEKKTYFVFFCVNYKSKLLASNVRRMQTLLSLSQLTIWFFYKANYTLNFPIFFFMFLNLNCWRELWFMIFCIRKSVCREIDFFSVRQVWIADWFFKTSEWKW